MKIRCLNLLALTLMFLSAGIALADTPESIVNNMFREVLKRNPTPEEFDYYRHLVIENGWDNSDLKTVLRNKKADAMDREINGEDYHRSDSSNNHYDNSHDRRDNRYAERDYYERRRWVEKSFQDRLGRLPSRGEMDDYCNRSLDEHYSRSDLDRRIDEDFRGQFRGRNSDEDRYNYKRYSSEEEVEIIIRDVYWDVWKQDVDDSTMRKYRRLMLDEGWSERSIRRDMEKNPELLWERFQPIVVRAYEDLLERTPTVKERDAYVDDMIRYRWDEPKLREMIKKSREYTYDRPRRFVEQAYKDTLLRDPDPGAYSLVNEIVRHDWSLDDVRANLRRSNEYRTQTIPKMIEMVYAELLNRKPDPYGINFYSDKARQGWTMEDIKKHIRVSDEYKQKHAGS